ncbi:MAG: M20/M25/M40 family metallo-hydrolase [Verrucomicrobiota bacterium]
MKQREFARLAERLLRCPAAPYHEELTRAAAEEICREHGLPFKRDRWGNVFVRYQSVKNHRPLVLAAHLDHPGFEVVRALGPKRWHARFLGGVGKNYFRRGVPVRLMPGAVSAKLGRPLRKEKEFEIIGRESTAVRPEFAVWELEDFAFRDGRIHGRVCDDLIGCAAILATLIELKRTRAKANVIGLLSRAEEVGFQGALAVAEEGSLSKNALVVSLETSRELPPVKMGQGMIVRVGDRSSIFDSAGTRFLTEVAAAIQTRDAKFKYQRALMSGGTCEATAFQEYGYQTAAVCVALGNYHNCGANDRIKAEFVDANDALGMVRVLVEAAKSMPRYDTLVGRLPVRLRKLAREGQRRLR